ncbi:MAG: hypothetical protein V3S43_05425 [Acidimicrobiia bacterium]|nr:hypothetical protein [Actinomycetota bacterium]
MDIEVESKRHPLRFMIKFLVLVGILVAAGKFMAKQKQDWSGITEAQAREKIESRLASRVGEEKATDIANQIVTVLTEKGVIKAEETADEVVDVTEETAEAVSDDAEAVEEVTAD